VSREEIRPDLGVEVRIFQFQNRDGQWRSHISATDIFGTRLSMTLHDFAAFLAELAADVSIAAGAEQ
jgi:hypothetical protein